MQYQLYQFLKVEPFFRDGVGVFQTSCRNAPLLPLLQHMIKYSTAVAVGTSFFDAVL